MLAAAAKYPAWVRTAQAQLDAVCGEATRLPTFDVSHSHIPYPISLALLHMVTVTGDERCEPPPSPNHLRLRWAHNIRTGLDITPLHPRDHQGKPPLATKHDDVRDAARPDRRRQLRRVDV